jgi:hypothetical protein
MSKLPYLAVAVGLIAILLVLIFWPWRANSDKSLAQCLTEKGVVMYGLDTCEECRSQKNLFGADFNKINYVNCDFHLNECRGKGITVYPVWSYGNKVLVGVQSINSLSALTGCK